MSKYNKNFYDGSVFLTTMFSDCPPNIPLIKLYNNTTSFAARYSEYSSLASQSLLSFVSDSQYNAQLTPICSRKEAVGPWAILLVQITNINIRAETLWVVQIFVSCKTDQ